MAGRRNFNFLGIAEAYITDLLRLGVNTLNERLNITGNIAFKDGGLKDSYFHNYKISGDQSVSTGDTVAFDTSINHYDNGTNRIDAGGYRINIIRREAWVLSATVQIESDGLVELVLWDDTNGVAVAANEYDAANNRFGGVTCEFIVNPSDNRIYKWRIFHNGSACIVRENTQVGGIVGTIFRAKRIVVYN